MMPPALATKSGAQRMPRSAQRGVERVVGELVVGGAGDRLAAQRGDGLVVEHRRRARTARGRRRRRSARDAGRSTPRRARSASARLLWSMSATTSSAPPSCSSSASRPPTLPRPITATCGPSRSAVPKARSQVARIGDLAAERGPRARVAGAARTARPVTCWVRSAITSMSGSDGADVLGGEVVARRAPRRCRRSPAATASRRSAASVGSSGRSMITPLPPPSGSPATAALKVIARERRSDVAHRGARVVVGPHPAAAERGPAGGRVHRDDREEPRAAPAADEQRLVVEGLEVAVDGASLARARAACAPALPGRAGGCRVLAGGGRRRIARRRRGLGAAVGDRRRSAARTRPWPARASACGWPAARRRRARRARRSRVGIGAASSTPAAIGAAGLDLRVAAVAARGASSSSAATGAARRALPPAPGRRSRRALALGRRGRGGRRASGASVATCGRADGLGDARAAAAARAACARAPCAAFAARARRGLALRSGG